MAGTKISALTDGGAAISGDDYLVLVDAPGGVATTKRSSVTDFLAASTFDTALTARSVVLAGRTSSSGLGWVVDEDDMVSDSATKVPTQQSVKAYVDANAGGAGDVESSAGQDASTFDWVLDEDDLVSDSDTDVPTQQSVKAYVDALPTLTTSDTIAVPITTAGGVTTIDVSNLLASGSSTFDDASFALQDNVDNTKQLQFDVANVATATTRTLSLPATFTADDALVLQATVMTLTNKTLSAPAINNATVSSPNMINSMTLGNISDSYTTGLTSAFLRTVTTAEYTANASGVPPVMASYVPTITRSATANHLTSHQGFVYGPTVQNDAAVAANFSTSGTGSAGRMFVDASTIQADTQNITVGLWVAFRSATAFTRVNSGTITDGSYTGFQSVPNVGTGVTLTQAFGYSFAPAITGTVATVKGLNVNNTTGGTITTLYGLDIAALTGGTTNIGIRNQATLRQTAATTFGADAAATSGTIVDIQAGHLAYNRSALTYASPTSVDVTLGNVFTVTTVNATGSVTFNATAGGKAGSQITIVITNDATSAKTITFGTNFRSAGTLSPGAASRIAVIMFTSDGTNWIETNRVNNVI